MYVATCEASIQFIWNAMLHCDNYHRLVCYFSYETSMAEEKESLDAAYLPLTDPTL